MKRCLIQRFRREVQRPVSTARLPREVLLDHGGQASDSWLITYNKGCTSQARSSGITCWRSSAPNTGLMALRA